MLQISLLRGLDPKAHIALGAALAPLRDEGVVFIGSGMSYHNMRGFFRGDAKEHNDHFDAWLEETSRLPASERNSRLARWTEAPSARQCHPREEHLIPLHVMSGAALDRFRVELILRRFWPDLCGGQKRLREASRLLESGPSAGSTELVFGLESRGRVVHRSEILGVTVSAIQFG